MDGDCGTASEDFAHLASMRGFTHKQPPGHPLNTDELRLLLRCVNAVREEWGAAQDTGLLKIKLTGMLEGHKEVAAPQRVVSDWDSDAIARYHAQFEED